jgi:hypothetical protein
MMESIKPMPKLRLSAATRRAAAGRLVQEVLAVQAGASTLMHLATCPAFAVWRRIALALRLSQVLGSFSVPPDPRYTTRTNAKFMVDLAITAMTDCTEYNTGLSRQKGRHAVRALSTGTERSRNRLVHGGC